MLSAATENDNYDLPGHADTTYHGWTNLMLDNLRIPQEERVSSRKRRESGFKLFMRPEQKKQCLGKRHRAEVYESWQSSRGCLCWSILSLQRLHGFNGA